MSLALEAVAVESVGTALSLYLMVGMDLRGTEIPLVVIAAGRMRRVAAFYTFQGGSVEACLHLLSFACCLLLVEKPLLET